MACAGDAYVGTDQRCAACPADYMLKLPNNGTGCECESGFVAKEHADGLWGRDISCMQQAAFDTLTASVPNADSSESSFIAYYDVLESTASSTIVESKLLQQLSLPAATECLRAVQAADDAPRELSREAGNAACQAIANLCVLQMYDATTDACQLYRELQSRSTTEVNGEEEWRARPPWPP